MEMCTVYNDVGVWRGLPVEGEILFVILLTTPESRKEEKLEEFWREVKQNVLGNCDYSFSF